MHTSSKHVLVVGAGAAGRALLHEIQREGRSDITLVGFVDDDPKKRGTQLKGIPVLGSIDDLPQIVRSKHIDQVLISTPSVGKELTGRVMQLIPPGLSVKVLPSISSVILGKVDLSLVRDIDPSDLIGRPLVKSNQEHIAKRAAGKSFLVTGGAGSIGSEIVRQLYDTPARRIVIVDAWEEGVFNLIEELRERNGTNRPKLEAYIGNIRDKARMNEIFEKGRVNTIIHAAAYKHVPLMESNPEEAVKTNYVGTRNVLQLAVRHGVKEFVLISTDKAVNPASIMGRTKRQAELLVKQFARKFSDRKFCAVRFGNVLNSSGSIVPIFLRQIRSRSAVTLTHRDMTRYFMSIPEAVSLVLLAWITGRNGQILVLDMGEPIKIADLAEQLIKMHGLEPGKDIPIKEIGIRPGEKIREELAYDKRVLRPSRTERIFIAEEL